MDNIEYHFHHSDGSSDSIIVSTNARHEIVVPDEFQPPDWTLLANQQCSNCTLSPEEKRYCPIARNIAYLFSGIPERDSYEPVIMEVVRNEVTCSANTTMQRALSSLLGLVCALSPCPRSSFLKPMGVFHLPLSTELDALSRTFSFFMMKKYFEKLENNCVLHINVDDLVQNYRNLRIMNRGIANRVRNIHGTDAPVNAIVLLDLLAHYIDCEIEDQLNELREVFAA